MPRSTVLTAAGAGVLVAGGLGGYTLWHQHQQTSEQDDGARSAATSFARAWEERSLEKASYVGTSPAGAAQNFRTATHALGDGPVSVEVGKVDRSGSTATATLRVSWTLADGTKFDWDDPVPLATSGDAWGVKIGDRSLWHPKLSANDAFAVNAPSTATRGEILGRGGAKIMSNQTVYDIQIDPGKATRSSVQQLEGVVSADPGSLTGKLRQAQSSGSKTAIPVITYRDSDYASRKSRIEGLTGVLVSERQQPLAPTRTFGQPLLGAVGPVTGEMIKDHPDRYRAGMYAGTSGLQAAYDQTLAPSGGLSVSPRSNPDQILHGSKPQNGKNLQTTLDPKVQGAAEAALTKTGKTPSALVAIDVKTGDVLAAANSPSYGINRALSGRYQPGSTLKVSSTYALLTKGFNPTTKVACPPDIVVDGRRIGNFEKETLSDPTFVEDFAHSCNTAFVQATSSLAPNDMHDAALALGIDQDWGKQLGVPAFTGSVPPTTGKVDQAAASFGQGRTLASPLAVAVMSGSVARGSFIPPALVSGQGGDRTPKPLDANAVSQLHMMMRQVVTNGSGTVMQGTPGGDVYAKTGTAEFTEKGEPVVRAWLTGWQGDVAFAVMVEQVSPGQTGGTVAAPVAKDFFTRLRTG
ncbi:penicillin-binding transpeptidase domain-containing protein [Luteipulveratus sp. YIM 133132]|uniref:penicillin-binding transpeptidase domain-containing protein n=1 Tax=Luteipulveratus flavus TaxID=3031728 RepID=UPI0023AFD2F9|nr:penicillin-binding transpeptidase domain-containing protein [Luteipulveratus sp. YIM 133132]MDE9364675.1 penicillin-binding transpeptidase domain-containing protein [Luteipulveratus sp. YIM 133132]